MNNIPCTGEGNSIGSISNGSNDFLQAFVPKRIEPLHFAYWLKGYFDIHYADHDNDQYLSFEQVEVIKDNLKLALLPPPLPLYPQYGVGTPQYNN